MIRYITRHGQVADARFIDGDATFPVGEPPLSELGREQARLLGERLKRLKFHGRIISSPYLRTLETAEIIAEITDTLIVPYAPIQEICKAKTQFDGYRGATIEEIREKFTHIAPEATLEYPWWLEAKPETEEMIRARMLAGYKEICERYKYTDLLFVGHGGSAARFVRTLGISDSRRAMMYNCSLTAVDPDNPKFKQFKFNTDHLPYDKITNNFEYRMDYDRKFFEKSFEGNIDLPELPVSNETVLHIGDTLSDDYPYLEKLFSLVKPHVIIHTGDLADEVKAGRIAGTRDEYVLKIKILLDMMKKTGARLIIVPGNNDLPDEIAKLAPEAEIYPRNAEVILSGVPCRLSHELQRISFDRKYCFYGHGHTGEVWSYEKNIPGQPCRFNAVWGNFVLDIANDRFVRIPHLIEK